MNFSLRHLHSPQIIQNSILVLSLGLVNIKRGGYPGIAPRYKLERDEVESQLFSLLLLDLLYFGRDTVFAGHLRLAETAAGHGDGIIIVLGSGPIAQSSHIVRTFYLIVALLGDSLTRTADNTGGATAVIGIEKAV
jgi:hypothetical protein|tara:strand:+ start:663 stop:1070 length:408 start_codon:yes stop_codon:yes gene_type:complete